MSSRFPDGSGLSAVHDPSADQRPIVALVVLPVLARLERAPPIRVLLIPANSSLETFRERDARLPTERGDARDVERLAIAVALPVRDALLHASPLARHGHHGLSDTPA